MDLSLDIRGGEELEKALLQLPTEIAVNELTKAVKAGADVIAAAMEEGAPRGHDVGPRRQNDMHLADSIAVQVEPEPIGSAVEVYVGPNKRVAWRAKFNEFGTPTHAIVNRLTRRMMKSGEKAKGVLASPDQIFGTHVNHPGEKPQPFMRNALAQSGNNAVEAIRTKLADGVKRAAAKLSKQWAPARKPKDYQP